MRYIRYFFLTLASLFLLVFLFIFSRLIVHEYLSFLASSVTDSCAFRLPVSCGLFEWDKKLQIAAYISYVFIMSIVTLITARILKYKNGKAIKKIAIFVYICCFPAYASWQVTRSEWHYCHTCTPKGVVVPVIMTFNVYTILSVILAGMSVWLYVKVNKILIR